jgi:hypothetical protein
MRESIPSITEEIAMFTSVTSRLVRFTVVASLVSSLGACAADAPVAAPQLPPAMGLMDEVPASAQSTDLTGVTTWKVFADTAQVDSTLVFGVDAAGNVVTESRIGGDVTQGQGVATVAMEALYPETGAFRLDADGKVVSTTLSPSAAAVFGAFGADFKANEDVAADPGARVSFRCIRAGVILGAACGVTIAGCLETVGLGCAVGGALCIAAYQDWLCECHHRGC